MRGLELRGVEAALGMAEVEGEQCTIGALVQVAEMAVSRVN